MAKATDFREEALSFRHGSRENRLLHEAADRIKGLESQLDKVSDAFNIPDWQDCVNAIKAALEDEDVNTDT